MPSLKCPSNTILENWVFRFQGLYYSYFLTMIEAPTFLKGVERLYNNNVTEYPDTINTLQRFNLYPEVMYIVAFNEIIYRDYFLKN